MSSNSVRAIVEAKLNTAWAGATPITWDNVDRHPTPGVEFISCLISGVFAETLSMKCQREHYIVTLEVFTPHGEGASGNMQLADTLVALFFNFVSGYLTVKTVRTERIGDRGEWHQRNVIIELTYNQVYP